MRKRVILFCVFVVVVMNVFRVAVERNADRHREDQRRQSRISNQPAPPDPPPWIEEAPSREPVLPTPLSTPPPDVVVEFTSESAEIEMDEQAEDADPVATLLAQEAQAPPGLLESLEETEDEIVRASQEPTEKTTGIVINEIMYHPMHQREREPVGEEFVELFNPTEQPITLTGYQFTKGINFTFGEETLPPGGYLVVAADPEAFKKVYQTNVRALGPWEGRLSNSSEEIRLEDGKQKLIDRVEYANEGDWADRMLTQRSAMSHRSTFSGRTNYTNDEGWVWACEADGGGSSLELVSARMPNNHGANWRPSDNRGGTPGAPNSRRAADIAPLISEVKHRPVVPQPNQKVLILAEIDDETLSTVKAEVVWRISSSRRRLPFQTATMTALADGRYAAVLPAQQDKTVIEFYVRATDGQQMRLWPSGDEDGDRANALYQVDSETNTTAMAFYRLIMTDEDNRRFANGNRHSNAETNMTLIADDGSGPVIRYQCGTRVRGAGSRSNTPPPMRVSLPRDRPWNGATKMNLNTVYPWLQHIGMKLFQASNLPAPNTFAVQVRRNGEDHARKNSRDYGAAVHVQPLDSQFLKEHMGDDDGGNLYKKVRPDNDWAWRGGDVLDYQSDGWLKQTNSSDWDWTDLDRFLEVMNNAPGQSDYLKQVESVMDVDQWLRYLAVMALLGNGEGGIANGIDDDYAIYRGAKDTRFQGLPHDLDTIIGVGEASSNPQHTLFDFADNGDQLEPLEPLFDEPEIRRRYFVVMAELLETSFSEEMFGNLLVSNLAGWVPASTVERMKDFMALRVAYARQEVRRALGTYPTRERPSSVALLESPPQEVMLSEVLAENASAHPHGSTFPDMIELFNPSKKEVVLAGMSLSDDPDVPGKFIFPQGAKIGAGEYRIVYADDQLTESEWHTGFSLKREGETLTLYGQMKGNERPRVDSISFGPQLADHSISRTGPNAQSWVLTSPSLGSANASEGVALGDIGSVRINEWLAAPQARFSNDFVELINVSDQPVSLGKVSLTSDYVRVPEDHRFPELSFIGPQDHLLMESLGKAAKRRHPCDLGFKLPSHSGWLRLLGANNVEIDKVHYTCQRPDVSQGRLPDGQGAVVYLTLPSPGAVNGAAKDAPSGIKGLMLGLRISEIMYHPTNPELEFIELTNIGGEVLSLNGVRFTGGIDYVFGEESLAPGACLVLVNNREIFAGQASEGIRVAGQYTGKLANSGEVIELTLPKPGNLSIQRFKYSDKWYATTDGQGRSLSIIDLQADVKRWDDLTNWRPSPQDGGTPGTL